MKNLDNSIRNYHKYVCDKYACDLVFTKKKETETEKKL